MIESGRYQCIVVGQGFSQSKKKGTPFFYLNIQPTTFAGLNGPESADHLSVQQVSWWLTEASVEFFKRDMQTLGYEGSEWIDELNPNHPAFCCNFVGKELECFAKEEPYTADDGTMKKSIKWKPMLFVAPPLDDDGASKLAKLFGKGSRTNGSTKRTSTPVASHSSVAGGDGPPPDDEIPF